MEIGKTRLHIKQINHFIQYNYNITTILLQNKYNTVQFPLTAYAQMED